jgi:hypothetical protein
MSDSKLWSIVVDLAILKHRPCMEQFEGERRGRASPRGKRAVSTLSFLEALEIQFAAAAPFQPPKHFLDAHVCPDCPGQRLRHGHEQLWSNFRRLPWTTPGRPTNPWPKRWPQRSGHACISIGSPTPINSRSRRLIVKYDRRIGSMAGAGPGQRKTEGGGTLQLIRMHSSNGFHLNLQINQNIVKPWLSRSCKRKANEVHIGHGVV